MPDFDPTNASGGAPSERIVFVAIAIVRQGGDILICQRKADAVLGGLWEFPGGKIEPDESPAAAAEREVREELDLVVRAVESLAPIIHDYPHATVHLTPFLCEYIRGEAKAIGCSTFKWIAAADLPTYPFPAANDTLIGQLVAQLR